MTNWMSRDQAELWLDFNPGIAAIEIGIPISSLIASAMKWDCVDEWLNVAVRLDWYEGDGAITAVWQRCLICLLSLNGNHNSLTTDAAINGVSSTYPHNGGSVNTP